MPDDDVLPPAGDPADDEPLETTDDNPEPGDDETPEPEQAVEPAEPDQDEPAEPAAETRRARGVPDNSQRDRRLTRQEEFDRAVDRAVERRLSNFRPSQPVDYEAQRRERDNRRRQELEEARLQGPEAYADVRDRHLREDYSADQRAREIRDSNQRFQDRFDRLCDRNRVYASIRADVERTADQLRGQGLLAPDLEQIANNILGKRYAERATRQGNQQRRNADAETRRQTVRAPGNSASTEPPQRRRSGRGFWDRPISEIEADLGKIPVRGS